jgi:predicted enzyme related to lactoylglutathione lyase
MLSSTDPERLGTWYAAVVPPQTDDRQDQYRILGYGGFYLFIDTRDDVAAQTAEPGRVILNFDVADAGGVAERVDGLGGSWVAPLEDRDGSLFCTAADPDGNYVQFIQLSPEHRAELAKSTTVG